jgi:two-component system, LytTR family, sensor kinase
VQVPRWLIAAGSFTAAAVLFTGQVRADYWYVGRHLSWARALAVSLVDWELWTLLSPAVLLLSVRVPLAYPPRARTFAIHITASLGLATGKLFAEAFVLHTFMGPGPLPGNIGKLYVALSVYWAIVAAVQFAEQRRLSRERALRASHLETELARAQVDALRMQLHPHFLFNTLNAISGLMREDVEAADLMLAQLSELLRTTLETEGRQEMPLAEEIGWLRTYFAIQQTRFGARLQVVIDVPDDCQTALVPTLILQPLVENAIRHGFSATPGPGRVSITVRQAEGILRIDVADEGPGAPQPIREGYGLRNTRSRLRALYRNEGALFVLPRLDRAGTLSRLDLPFRLGSST